MLAESPYFMAINFLIDKSNSRTIIHLCPLFLGWNLQNPHGFGRKIVSLEGSVWYTIHICQLTENWRLDGRPIYQSIQPVGNRDRWHQLQVISAISMLNAGPPQWCLCMFASIDTSIRNHSYWSSADQSSYHQNHLQNPWNPHVLGLKSPFSDGFCGVYRAVPRLSPTFSPVPWPSWHVVSPAPAGAGWPWPPSPKWRLAKRWHDGKTSVIPLMNMSIVSNETIMTITLTILFCYYIPVTATATKLLLLLLLGDDDPCLCE